MDKPQILQEALNLVFENAGVVQEELMIKSLQRESAIPLRAGATVAVTDR